MDVWIVMEIETVEPASGCVVGIFNNEAQARAFWKEWSSKKNRITQIEKWHMNERLPIDE